MDKNTLSNYGWIVIAVLVLSVMIALATPFGSYIEQGVRATTEGLFDTSKNAVNTAFEDLGVQMDDQTFEEGYTGVNKTPASELPAKGKTLEQYTWEEAQNIIAAGKAGEYGFAVGSTKTLQINGATKTATIIGLNHDGSNTATFMIVSSGGIGHYTMNSEFTNAGGWKDSEMHTWLNTTIYESMTDTKAYIKEVSKYTDNIGYKSNSVSATNDKVFLLSAKEAGVEDDVNSWVGYPEEYKQLHETEGTTYTWFESNTVDEWFWLRSPFSDNSNSFFGYTFGSLNFDSANFENPVCPAFVIG